MMYWDEIVWGGIVKDCDRIVEDCDGIGDYFEKIGNYWDGIVGVGMG